MASALRLAGSPLAKRMRAGSLAIISPTLSKILFRLSLGRWPDAGELRLFRSGLVNQAVRLPPCLRAMLPLPDAKPIINQFLLLDMVRTGQLRMDNAFDRHHAADDQLSVPPLSGNPLAFWQGPAVAFLHLEKTGGGAVAQALADACHPKQIDPDPRRTAAAHAIVPFAGRDTAVIRRYALIFGHYDLPSLRQLDPERPVITVVRDPARRIVSLYYYWRSVRRDVLDTTVGNDAVKLAHDCDLLAFLQTRDPSVRNYIDNCYARRLTGIYVSADGDDALARDPATWLDRALDALHGIEFVGVTEQMAPTLQRLGQRFALDTGSSVERHNVAADNAQVAPRIFNDVMRAPLTPDHEAALAGLTKLDSVLYAAACKRFNTEAGPRPTRLAAT